ncbi:MAG: hypothetical protein HY074_08765 [Deltaproteobacteria bacterium]|nr:hypothetical protein [Deltaproteobacteria bacterium]
MRTIFLAVLFLAISLGALEPAWADQGDKQVERRCIKVLLQGLGRKGMSLRFQRYGRDQYRAGPTDGIEIGGGEVTYGHVALGVEVGAGVAPFFEATFTPEGALESAEAGEDVRVKKPAYYLNSNSDKELYFRAKDSSRSVLFRRLDPDALRSETGARSSARLDTFSFTTAPEGLDGKPFDVGGKVSVQRFSEFGYQGKYDYEGPVERPELERKILVLPEGVGLANLGPDGRVEQPSTGMAALINPSSGAESGLSVDLDSYADCLRGGSK